MEYYITLNSQQTSIVLMRVENGWIVRTHEGASMVNTTPLRVAETPEALLAIVKEWTDASDQTSGPRGDHGR